MTNTSLLGATPYPMVVLHLKDDGGDVLRDMNRELLSKAARGKLPTHLGICLSYAPWSSKEFIPEVEDLCAVREKLRVRGFAVDIHIDRHGGKCSWLETLKKRYELGTIESSFALESAWWFGYWTRWGLE